MSRSLVGGGVEGKVARRRVKLMESVEIEGGDRI